MKLRPKLRVSRAEAEKRIRDCVVQGEAIRNLPIRSRVELDAARLEKDGWSKRNSDLLKTLYENDDVMSDYSLGYAPVWGLRSIEADADSFRGMVDGYISKLSSFLDRLEFAEEPAPRTQPVEREILKSDSLIGEYVAPERIAELRAIRSRDFDLSKLIRLCEELNICSQYNCYFAMAMLARTIIDHVPPIFGRRSFTEVANSNHKSLKDVMLRLDTSLRNIADLKLHTQIRDKETLPLRQQVDFHADLDVLLSEIVRRLNSTPNSEKYLRGLKV